MSEWRDIGKAPKRIKAGYMRIYSFKPVINQREKNWSLSRAYQFDSRMGSRECDLYMDIPIPQTTEPMGRE